MNNTAVNITKCDNNFTLIEVTSAPEKKYTVVEVKLPAELTKQHVAVTKDYIVQFENNRRLPVKMRKALSRVAKTLFQ